MKYLFYTGVAIYHGGGVFKMSLIFLTATIFVPFLDSLERFLAPNMDSFAIFTILLFLDVISGVYKHSGLWDKDAKNTLNKDAFFFKLLKKIFASVVWLTLVNAIEKYAAKAPTIGEYLNLFGVAVLLAWLVWSIAENVSVITKGEFPPTDFMKRFKRVKDTGDFKQLNENVNEVN